MLIKHIAFIVLTVPLIFGIGLGAQPRQAAVTVTRIPPPLGLPRLKEPAQPGDPAPLAAAKFAADELKPQGAAGVSAASRGNRDYLALAANSEWSRSLRGLSTDTTFVSFQVLASPSTVIEIGGAWLGVIESATRGYFELMIGQPEPAGLRWREAGVTLRGEIYGGAAMAALPVLTVRLDPGAGLWDLHSHGDLISAGNPLSSAGSSRRFLVRAGQQGAWVCGLVLADENPLIDDANANGIEDNFERRKRGVLLSAATPAFERKALAEQWGEFVRSRPQPVWIVRRPLPDRLTPATAAGGKQ